MERNSSLLSETEELNSGEEIDKRLVQYIRELKRSQDFVQSSIPRNAEREKEHYH